MNINREALRVGMTMAVMVFLITLAIVGFIGLAQWSVLELLVLLGALVFVFGFAYWVSTTAQNAPIMDEDGPHNE